MSLPISPQEDHFNVNGFERETEERLIQILLHEKVNGWFIWPNKVRRSLHKARDMLKNEFNVSFSLEQLHNHLSFLSKRNDTFMGLRENPLVRWEYNPNTFHACDIVWNELRQMNNDVEWYYFKGEYAYKDLLRIFIVTGNELGYHEQCASVNMRPEDIQAPNQSRPNIEYPSPNPWKNVFNGPQGTPHVFNNMNNQLRFDELASPSLQEVSENTYHSTMKKEPKPKHVSTFSKIKKKLFRGNDKGPSRRFGGN